MFPVLMFVAALVVLAVMYICGSALHVGILHPLALLGAAGAVLTAFMTAALHEA